MQPQHRERIAMRAGHDHSHAPANFNAAFGIGIEAGSSGQTTTSNNNSSFDRMIASGVCVSCDMFSVNSLRFL